MNASEASLPDTEAAEGCVLCAQAGGQLIWQTPALRVVLVDDADLPGYTRVILAEHIAEMTALPPGLRQAIMEVVFTVEQVQRDMLNPDKVNLASLGNMTPHLHWHVIPRWRDDPWFPDAIWAPRRAGQPAAGAEPPGRTFTDLDDYVKALASALRRQHEAV